MLFLSGDVFRHGLNLGLSDREHAVALLPVEVSRTAVRLHPDRAFAFDVTDQGADEDLFAERDEQVNVINRAASDKKFAALFVDDAVDVGAEAVFECWIDEWLAVFGGEDDMEKDLGERLGHGMFVPFRDGAE